MSHQNCRAKIANKKSAQNENRKPQRKAIAGFPIEVLEPRIQLSASLMRDTLSYPLGDFEDANLTLNNGAAISNAAYEDQLQLADGGTNESRSAFTDSQYNVASFSTNFNVEFSGPSTSGLAFVIQPTGASAVGVGNAGSDGISKAVSLEFLATSSGTETLLNVNGTATTPTLVSPSSIDFSNGRVLQINVEYAGTTLKVTETDNQNTLTPAVATQNYSNVNIAQAVGGSYAFFGFTGADTSVGVTQVLQSWEFANNPPADTDIGSPSAIGSSVYSTGGNYTVSGAGTGAAGASDQLHFLSQSITGDNKELAQLSTPSAGSNAVEGLMLRESSAANSAFAEIDDVANGAQFISRSAAGATATASVTMSASGAEWLELVRDGSDVSGYISTTSSGPWTLVGTGAVTGPSSALMGLAVSSGSSGALVSANFAGVSLTAATSIGVDTAPAAPISYQPIWQDLIKQATGFYEVNSSTPAPVNSIGWPTTDFEIPSITVVADDAGTYNFSMQVSQNPNVRVFSASMSNASYNSITQLYTATVTIPGPGRVVFVVTNTGPGAGSGATNIQLLRTTPAYMAGSPFAQSYVQFLQSLHPTVLRFMNWTQANNNPVANWADRELPSDPTQTETATAYNLDGSVYQTGENKGSSWEYAIMLANEVHTDMWINIPAQATPDYIKQLASLIEYGDTVNGVSYPALDPDLNVYVEYSNETWNQGFEVYSWATDNAVAAVTAGSAGTPNNLNYDGLSLANYLDQGKVTYDNGPTWELRWTAYQLMQISNDFASVLPAGSINTRYRMVLSNLGASQLSTELTYIATNDGPPSNYFYSVASVFYANLDGPNNSTNILNGGNDNPNLSINDIFNTFSENSHYLSGEYAAIDAVASEYGLNMDGYESGTDFGGYQSAFTGKISAETSAIYTTFLEQYYQDWYSNGGGTIIYYTGGVRPWGSVHGDYQISDDQTDLYNAKEIGFRDVTASEHPSLLPAALTSLTGMEVSSTQVNLNWSSTSTGATEYRVEASPASDFSSNVATQIAPPSDTSWSFTGLSPGVTYYFRVLAASPAGDAAPTPSATVTTSGTVPVPAAPANVTETSVSPSQIHISWTDASFIETGFTITIATNSNFSSVVQTLTAAADATTISAFGLNQNTTYYVRVLAGDSTGSSAAVNSASPVTTPLAVPLAQYAFNEGSGNSVNDTGTSSYPPATGTIMGGITRVAGPNGTSALSFDGTTGYVNLGTPAKLDNVGQFAGGQMTVSAWINTASPLSSAGGIVSQDWDGVDTPFFLELTNSTTVKFGTFRFGGPSGPITVQATGTSAAPLADGNWHLLVGVYDGQNFNVYIDGKLAGTTSDPYGVAEGATSYDYIGTDHNNSNGVMQYFQGEIAEVQIYGYGLSATDVAKLAQPTTDTWTGAVSSSWNNVQNWTAGLLPGPLTNVIINNGNLSVTSPFNIGALTLTGGTLQFSPGIGGSTVSGVTLSGGGTLDLTNDHLLINYALPANDPRASIVQYLKSGSNSELWNGSGIDSSTAAANPTHYGVGYADSVDGLDPSLASGQLEIAYALNGDINLDGHVNGTDFAVMAKDFGKPSSEGWAQADLNYDGSVGPADFALLATNFGHSAVNTAVVISRQVAANSVFSTQAFALSFTDSPTSMLKPKESALVPRANRRNTVLQS